MNRSFGVKSLSALIAGATLLSLAGCGGGGHSGLRGEVSGVVFDVDGYVVRDASVESSGESTVSNSAGVYALTDIPARDVVVTAEVTRNGVRYLGQNVATVTYGERTKNVNIAVYREDQLASMYGTVRDVDGHRLQGIRVFLRPDDDPSTTADDTLLTSAVAVTDSNGQYSVGRLCSGLTYRLQVNGRTYNSAMSTVNLSAGENRQLNLTVPDGTEVSLPVPSNLSATAYTSPSAVRGDSKLARAVESLRQKLRPKATHTITRTTVRGNPIEVDLFWDPSQSTGLLGDGIYRGTNGGALRNVDFLRDPEAVFFADYDDNLVENTSYSYAISALDTLYDGTYGETDVSNAATVSPLGDLILSGVTAGAHPTFRWQSVYGATRYSVFLYTEYPTIGVDYTFTNYDSPVNGTSYTYDGAALTSGRTLYYIVTAERPDQSAVSFSQVGLFTVP